MSVSSARLVLFLIWLGVWLAYVVLFLGTTLKDIPFELAFDAAWKVSYVLLPIVSAFASFWFTAKKQPSARTAPDDQALLPFDKTVATFAITGAVNAILFLVFLFGVVLPDFNAPDSQASYPARVDMGVKFMVVLASFVALPVGFLLGEPVPPAKKPS